MDVNSIVFHCTDIEQKLCFHLIKLAYVKTMTCTKRIFDNFPFTVLLKYERKDDLVSIKTK